jgi:hypothetical protein
VKAPSPSAVHVARRNREALLRDFPHSHDVRELRQLPGGALACETCGRALAKAAPIPEAA